MPTVDYSTQTISSYNSNPPPDDATTGSNNVLKWSNHKTKLADPIKALIENVNTELVTTFAEVVTDMTAVENKTQNITSSGHATTDWGAGTNTPGVNLAGSTSDATGNVLHAYDATNEARSIVEGNLGAFRDDIDLGGAANDKWSQWETDGGVVVLRSLNDDGTTRTDNIISADMGTGQVTIADGEFTAITKGGDEVPRAVSGTWTSGSLTTLTSGETSVAHGLGTDNVAVIISGKGSVDQDFIVSWAGTSGQDAHIPGSGYGAVIAADTLTAPATGNVRLQAYNGSGSTQTVTIYYTIIGLD